jgi:hypothetical protein
VSGTEKDPTGASTAQLKDWAFFFVDLNLVLVSTVENKGLINH